MTRKKYERLWFTLPEIEQQMADREPTADRGLIRKILMHLIAEGHIEERDSLDPRMWREGCDVDWSTGQVMFPRRGIPVTLWQQATPAFRTTQVFEIINDLASSDDDTENVNAPNPAPRKRGARATEFPRVVGEMEQLSPDHLGGMKEEEMRATFGASRDTCRRARNEVLSRVGASNKSRQ